MGIIRFVLAIWVCMGHVGYNFPFWTATAGVTPVAAFFVISGFYMALILNGKYINSLKAFYANRALRLLPIYFVVCSLTLLGMTTLQVVPHFLIPWNVFQNAFELSSWGGKIYLLMGNLFAWGVDLGFFSFFDTSSHQMVFTQNAGQGCLPLTSLFLVPQAWTLSLEMYFYLLAPFVVRRFATIIVVLCLSLLSYMIPYEMGLHFFHYMRFFPVALSYFMIGAAIYWLYRKYRNGVKRYRYLAVLLIPFVVLVSVKFRSIPFDERLNLILFVALVAMSIPFAFELMKNWRGDKFIGDLSYPIYINHLAVNLFIININFINDKPLFSLLGSIVVAIIIHVVMEKRIDIVRQKIALIWQ